MIHSKPLLSISSVLLLLCIDAVSDRRITFILSFLMCFISHFTHNISLFLQNTTSLCFSRFTAFLFLPDTLSDDDDDDEDEDDDDDDEDDSRKSP